MVLLMRKPFSMQLLVLIILTKKESRMSREGGDYRKTIREQDESKKAGEQRAVINSRIDGGK